nr:DNA cytosine methyltransferase [Salinibaculum sp. KK48]
MPPRYSDTDVTSIEQPDQGVAPGTGSHYVRGNGPIPALDLFCGGGGASLGMLFTPDVEIALGVDHNEQAVETYRRNFNHPVVQHDLTDISLHVLREHMVPEYTLNDILWVHGSPPCTGFSDARGATDVLRDENTLIETFIDWVNRIKPAVVTMENVPGMAHNADGAVMEYLEDAFWANGYCLEWEVLDAAKYGVPQHRERLIAMAVPSGANTTAKYWFPQQTHAAGKQQTLASSATELSSYVTTHDAIDDLPHPRNDKTIEECAETRLVGTIPNHEPAAHTAETREYFAEFSQGETKDSVTARRLAPDVPAPTMSVSNGTPPIHYAGDAESARRLTVREVARLQGFPDSFEFHGPKTAQFRVAGNAVPPRLQRCVAAGVKRNLSALSNREVPYDLRGYTPPNGGRVPNPP